MKKMLLLITLVACAMTSIAQDVVKVTTKEGMVMAGNFVSGTDSTYTIKCTNEIRNYVINRFGSDTVTFRMDDIYEVNMYGKVFIPMNGQLTPKEKANELVGMPSNKNSTNSHTYTARPSDPNYVIGRALKSTGSVALGLGIPCLLAGTILTAVGYSSFTVDLGDGYLTEKEALDKLEEIGNKATNRGKMQIAGHILLPVGASLTIIGIPLHVHGRKLMDINLNYTGNGVGVAMEF
jgi:hypothetical protein